MSMDELANVKGRGWEDIDVRGPLFVLICSTDSNRSTDHARKLQTGSHLATQVRCDWPGARGNLLGVAVSVGRPRTWSQIRNAAVMEVPPPETSLRDTVACFSRV